MKTALARRAAAQDTFLAFANSGILRFYGGTKPANVAAAQSNTVLAECSMSATAFGTTNTSTGIATANAIAADSSCNAQGTITHASLFESNGTTRLVDVTVTTTAVGTGEILLGSVSADVGISLTISSFTVTAPDGT
jgi:hypothetical protein